VDVVLYSATHPSFKLHFVPDELPRSNGRKFDMISKHPDAMDMNPADVCSVTKHIPELLSLEGFHVLLAF
jgi:hypothetical protein